MKNLLVLCATVLGWATAQPLFGQADPLLAVSFGNDSYPTVTLQNSVLTITVRTNFGGGYYGNESHIRDFIPRSTGTNIANFLDANSNRGLIQSATLTNDGVDVKTVRMVFSGNYNILDYTIYANSPVLRIDYITYGSPNFNWVNMVDLLTSGESFKFYGQESFIRPITYYPCSYWNTFDDLISGGCGIDYRNTDPPDGGSLNLNGYIVGAFGQSNGIGIGRVFPIFDNGSNGGISILKLLDGLGFESYHGPGPQTYRPAFTSWIYLFENGLDAAIAQGQQIASSNPLPIQLMSFTATVIAHGQVRLDWSTLTETNNYGFEVEKSHGGEGAYQLIPNSFVPGHGTTLEPHYYGYVDDGTSPGIWYYRIKQIDLNGTIHYTDGIRVDLLTDVPQERTPMEFKLDQNYPNPFNPTTLITFSIPHESHVTLEVFDVMGRKSATLVDELRAAGTYTSSFDASKVASGMYFYKLTSADGLLIRKMMVMR